MIYYPHDAACHKSHPAALAPRNTVAAGALIVSAGAVSGAVLLLLELYQPFDGLIRSPSDPLLIALGQPVN